MRAAILLVAGFTRLGALWSFLAVAHYLSSARGDALHAQNFFRASCPPVAESEVVLGRSALIAMALDDHLKAGKLREDVAKELGVALERRERIGRYLGAVVGEVDVFEDPVHSVDALGFGFAIRRGRRLGF